jgi:hypothetical protein
MNFSRSFINYNYKITILTCDVDLVNTYILNKLI